MIDIQNESIIAFRDLPAWTEENLGTRISPNTCHRWRLRGVRGIRLSTILIGGSRCTSVEALQRFFEASTQAQDGESATVASLDASKNLSQAESFLASEGI